MSDTAVVCVCPPSATLSADEVGDLGHGLAWLLSSGFPVAPLWMVSVAAFDEAIERAGQADTVADINWQIKGLWNDLPAIRRVLGTLELRRAEAARALAHVSLPDLLAKELEAPVLMDTHWTVRPSLVGDHATRLAGQFPPLLAVPGGRRLWHSIRQVWARAFDREVLSLCAQHEIGLPRLAVILQPMEPSQDGDRSGAFVSCSSLPGLTGPLIQARPGLQPGPPQVYTCVVGRWIRIRGRSPETDRQPDVLTSEEAGQVARLGQAVAERQGQPVKIEFIWQRELLLAAVGGQWTVDSVRRGNDE